MKTIIQWFCVFQFIPAIWVISWVFSPAPNWTWQWVPAMTCNLVLYLLSIAITYKALKSIAKGYK